MAPVAGSKSRPAASRRPSTVASEDLNAWLSGSVGAMEASRPQYVPVRNAIRSRSRCTMILVATDCTRPAESFGMTFFHSTGETS